jgi:hypothetical protein
MFTAILGDGCDSVIALDDVDISEGFCAGKTTLFFSVDGAVAMGGSP